MNYDNRLRDRETPEQRRVKRIVGTAAIVVWLLTMALLASIPQACWDVVDGVAP